MAKKFLSYNDVSVIQTYGQVLLELLDKEVESGNKDKFLNECKNLKDLSGKMLEELGSSSFAQKEVLDATVQLLKEAHDWDVTLWAWCEVVVAEGRFIYMSYMLDFVYEMSYKEVEPTYITSARELSDDEKKICLSFCKGHVPVEDVRFVVENGLLGGICVRQGWKKIDISLQNLLEQAMHEVIQGV